LGLCQVAVTSAAATRVEGIPAPSTPKNGISEETRKKMEQSAERNLTVLGEMCILCGTGKLRTIKGKHGPFIACSNFFDPQIKCPFTRAIAQETYETE